MILTCPSCTMRYLVAEGAVGPDGRRIKCAHCGHQWFQEGEQGLDEALFGDGAVPPEPIEIDMVGPEGTEPSGDFKSILQKEIADVVIPEGVKPTGEDVVIPPAKVKKAIKLPKPDDRVKGFASAAAVFAVALGLFLYFHPVISRAWPPSNLLYGFFGMEPAAPGEGLTLNNLQAKFDGKKVMMMGDITNAGETAQKVPPVLASFIDNDKKILGSVLIAPPAASVEPGAHVSFDVGHPAVPEAATAVTYAFTYMKVEEAPKEEPKSPGHEKADKAHDASVSTPAAHH